MNKVLTPLELGMSSSLFQKIPMRIRLASFLLAGMVFNVNAENVDNQVEPLPNLGVNTNIESISQQKKTVIGTVLDASGIPVIGANVMVKGTTNGSITDMDGKFTLEVPEGAVLEVSYIGYTTQNVKVGNQKSISVILKEDTQALDEVVVVGYGTMKKSDITGSVTSVKSEDMLKRNPVNLGQGLQGAAAGVSVMRTSGDPEGGVSIRIRGVATVNGSSDPLYVVDGVQVGTSVDFLNPADIESIEILKDASATAIYGSQGANGVILITTKTGLKEQTSLKFTAHYGIQNMSNRIDVANAAQFVEAVRMSKQNDNAVFTNKAWENPAFTNQLYSIDWQDVMARTALQQNYNLSASGGSEKTQARLSVGYLNNEGVVVNSYFKRLTARANVNHKIKNFIRTGLSIAYVHAEKTGGGNLFEYAKTIPTMDDTDANGNLINVPVQYPDGTWGHFKQEGNGDISKSQDNPYAAAMEADYLNKYNRVVTSANVEIDIVKGLTFKTIGSYNYYGGAYSSYSPYNDRTFLGKDSPDSFSLSSNEGNSMGLESYFTYNLDLKEHHLNVMAGYSVSDYQSSEVKASAQNMVASTIRQIALTKDANTITGGGGFNTAVRFVSWYGRLNYSFKNRYMITATVRRDGSSKFGAGNRFGTFPSASFAWRASEEGFIKDLDIFSNLKLRLGWGQTGNSGSATNLSVEQVSPNRIMYYWLNNGNYVSAAGLAKTAEIDTNLKWETNEQTNVGLDIGLLNNDLNITLDYYIRDAKDLLLYRNLRPLTGYKNIYTNAGHIRNSGFEVTVGYNKNFGDWTFGATLNAATLKNKAIEVGDDIFYSDGVSSGYYWNNYSITRNGYPVASFYGHKVAGIFQTQDEIDQLNAQASKMTNGEITAYQTSETQPGDYKYVDINGDGYISDEDKTILGDGYPTLNYGLNLSTSYKNWDLSMYMYGVLGQDILSYSYANLTSIKHPTDGYQNCLVDYVNNAWSIYNPSDIYPRLTRRDSNHNTRVSDAFIKNGDFLRISNLQIGYTLPRHISNMMKMESVRIYGSIENLATITGYKYGDPEVGDSKVLKTGFDGGRYPYPRTYSFGVSVQF